MPVTSAHSTQAVGCSNVTCKAPVGAEERSDVLGHAVCLCRRAAPLFPPPECRHHPCPLPLSRSHTHARQPLRGRRKFGEGRGVCEVEGGGTWRRSDSALSSRYLAWYPAIIFQLRNGSNHSQATAAGSLIHLFSIGQWEGRGNLDAGLTPD
eukprot:1762577-Rhodomonas_salina.1